MAKLDIAASQIQSTTNMIISGDTTTAWSDAKYPSAKAAFDNAHPIGSIVVTSTNTNPATALKGTREWLGGTWELVDKEFKNSSANIASLWTSSRATASGSISWADHSICIKMWLVTDNNPLSPGNGIGTIDRTEAGVTSFSYSDEGGVAFAITGTTNTIGYVIKYKLEGSGNLSLERIYDETVAAFAGATIHIQTIIPMSNSDMLDSFCDKFYWKRIA